MRWLHRLRVSKAVLRQVWDATVHSVELAVVPILLAGSVALVIFVVRRAIGWVHLADGMADPMARIQAGNLIFDTLGQLVAGGFVLAGLYFSAKSFVLSRNAQTAIASPAHWPT